MPSFLLFMLGINSFLKAESFKNGKYYFLTFLFLFGAFLTKITIAVFFPALLVISIFMMKGRSKNNQRMAYAYLYVPFIIASIAYTFFYWSNLMVYINTHKNLGIAEGYDSIVSLIWDEMYILALLAIPNAFLLFTSKKVKQVVSLIVLAAAIPVFHLALHRFSTLDKHLYLSVIFLSVLVGLGLSLAAAEFKGFTKLVLRIGLPIVCIFYFLDARSILYIRENDWTNS